jgi:hypothetical protein
VTTSETAAIVAMASLGELCWATTPATVGPAPCMARGTAPQDPARRASRPAPPSRAVRALLTHTARQHPGRRPASHLTDRLDPRLLQTNRCALHTHARPRSQPLSPSARPFPRADAQNARFGTANPTTQRTGTAAHSGGSSTSGHLRTRRCNRRAERSAGSWRARRMGTAGVIRHLPAGPEPGRPGLSSLPPRLGREAGDARQR